MRVRRITIDDPEPARADPPPASYLFVWRPTAAELAAVRERWARRRGTVSFKVFAREVARARRRARATSPLVVAAGWRR